MKNKFIEIYIKKLHYFLKYGNVAFLENSRKDFIYRYYMPYVLQELKNGEYIVLNREYKTLGTPFYDLKQDYEKLTDFHIFKDLLNLEMLDENLYFYKEDFQTRIYRTNSKRAVTRYKKIFESVFDKIIKE
jgi:hypothetical protein